MQCEVANRETGTAARGWSPAAQPLDVERFRAIAIFADDLKEWRCEFSAARSDVANSPVQLVERLFQALSTSDARGAEGAPEINFAIAHESARALTAAGKARRAGGDAVPFVLMVTGAV